MPTSVLWVGPSDKRQVLGWAVIVPVLCVCILAAEGEVGAQGLFPQTEKDARVSGILNELGSNESARLPPARILGEFNEEAIRHSLPERGPGYRNFCSKMVWAPERQRALYAGANHGVPHRLNDVWEYDLAANAWYLLYAPDPSVRSHNRQLLEEIRELREHPVGEVGEAGHVSVMQTERGGPAHLSHTYWGITYDPDQELMLWNILGSNKQGTYEGLPLWSFSPETREWAPVLTPRPRPGTGGVSALEFVEALGGVVRYSAAWQSPGMWVLPSNSSSWRNLKPNEGTRVRGCEACPGTKAVFAYVPEAQLLVAVDGTRTHHYLVNENRWVLVVDEREETDGVPKAHYGSSVFGWDPESQRLLLYSPDSHPFVWAYNVWEKQWDRRTPNGPSPPPGDVIGYVDPARGVMVLNKDRDVWLYRH